jgi:glycosyltransferase involved in cell wall biosynthesis
MMLAHRLPPCVAFPTNSARVHGLASWLGDFEWCPIVLTPEIGSVCACEGCSQATSRSDVNYEILHVPVQSRRLEQPAEQRRQSAFEVRRITTGIVAASNNVRHLIKASVSNLDMLSDWPLAALAAGESVLKSRQVDALWATYRPVSSLWAGDAIARRNGLPWVADIRDSLEMSWNLANYKDLAALARARRILRRAAAVVEVTPEHADRDGPWLGRPCETITSGFDPNQWRDVLPLATATDRDNLRVVCIGKIYPGYLTLGPALAGLSRLRAEAPGARVRLIYYGRSHDVVREDAARHGLEDITECRGFVPPDELRAHLASADVLLLPTNQAGHSGVPGGKFYEYLAARRPILAVPGEDRFVTGVLHETGAGVAATSPEQVSAVLGRWLEEWSRTGEIAYTGREDAVNRYSIRESARRLAALLDAATDGHTSAMQAVQRERFSGSRTTAI